MVFGKNINLDSLKKEVGQHISSAVQDSGIQDLGQQVDHNLDSLKKEVGQHISSAIQDSGVQDLGQQVGKNLDEFIKEVGQNASYAIQDSGQQVGKNLEGATISAIINNKSTLEKLGEVMKVKSDQTVNNNEDYRGAIIGVLKGNVSGNAKVIAQYNESPSTNISLTETASEIQTLLNELNKTYPTNTNKQKMEIAVEAIECIEQNPSLTQRLISATKAGTLAAIESMLDHPAASFVIAAIEDLNEQKNVPVDYPLTNQNS